MALQIVGIIVMQMHKKNIVKNIKCFIFAQTDKGMYVYQGVLLFFAFDGEQREDALNRTNAV